VHDAQAQSESGQFEIVVPRDHNATFEPQLVKKRQPRLKGFDEKVVSLYARGLSTREIQSQLQELYGVEVLFGIGILSVLCHPLAAAYSSQAKTIVTTCSAGRTGLCAKAPQVSI